ncbi:unnamed protein product [Clonostachys rhizophaga]|uniref:Uncharacterized protein n=1 Tax=Clonostachys rhizophaga TaxID=160324 RepID=A0A9N9YRR6_9HYPO|nr:unnamed protein product [Clonostachys rhizophaga]
MEAAAGSQILGEIEEMSLEEVLLDLRTTASGKPGGRPPPKATHIEELDGLIARQFRATQVPTLSITGRHHPLLYKVVSRLVSPPFSHAVLILDLDGRFDTTRLTCTDADARHIYIQRPSSTSIPSSAGTEEAAADTTGDNLKRLVAEAQTFMLYGEAPRPSAHRHWWGTIVIQGFGVGDVVAGWKGWLRVDREHVRGFPPGCSAEEALAQRSARHDAVDSAGWAAESQWGGFVFYEGGEGA